MTSQPIRDQVDDQLLTPKNCALIIIDYQPVQVGLDRLDMDRRDLVTNIVARRQDGEALRRADRAFDGKKDQTGANQPTIHQLADALDGIEATSIAPRSMPGKTRSSSTPSRQPVQELLMTALWTEACLSFPTLDALREGYEIYPIVDAVGGTSPRRTVQHSSGSSKPERGRRAGFSSSASCSATGRATRPRANSPRFSSRSKAVRR